MMSREAETLPAETALGGETAERRLQHALNENLAGRIHPIAALLGPAAILTIGLVLGEAVATLGYRLVLLASVAVAALEVYVAVRFRRSPTRLHRPAYWRRIFLAVAMVGGIVWGAAGVLLFVPENQSGPVGFIVPLLLAAVCGAYVAWRSASPIAVVVFVTLALGPLVAMLALSGSSESLALAGMLCLYAAGLGAFCLNNHRVLVEAITLRLDRDLEHARLRESATTLARIAENLPDAIFQAVVPPGSDGYLSYVSGSLIQLLALPPDHAPRSVRSIIGRIDPRDRERVRSGVRKRVADGQVWNDEFRVQHPEKGLIWIESHASAETHPDGSRVWYGSMRETTERRQLVDRIRVQAAAMATADTGIVIVDSRLEEKPIIYANRAFEEIVGHTCEGDLSCSLFEFVARSPEDQGATELRDALRRDEPVSMRVQFNRRSGDPFWAEVTVSAVVGIDGDRTYQTVIIADVSERLRIEAELKASEARYRSIVEDQVELICRFKPDTTLTYVNPAYATSFGRTSDDLLGRPFIAFLPASDRPRALEHLSRITPQRPLRSFEYRVTRPDGEVRWQEWTDRGIFDETGELIEFQSIGRDITDRKKIEAQLRDSEARYRSIVEQHLDMIVRFKPDTLVTFANEVYCRHVGVPMSEIVGFRFLDYVPDDEKEAVLAHYNGFTLAEPWKSFEHHVVLPDGRRRLHRWTDRAVFDDDGNVVEIQSIGRDVTEDKARQERIRLLAAVFEATRDGVFVIDDRWRIITVNEAFARITQYEQGEVAGRDLRRLPAIAASRKLLPAIVGSVRSKGFWKGEVWGCRKNGDRVPLLCSINALIGDDGQIVNYVGVFTDITRLKETERRLVDLANNDELTGLPNRRKFVADLDAAMRDASQSDEGLAVHYLDLDDFKYVNDTYGHDIGDRLLTAVAGRLQSALRTTDLVSRFGGDEFLILQPNVRSKLQASVLAERVRSCFETPVEIEPGREIFIQTSVGISRFPGDGESALELIGHADAAAYQAKREGKGSYQFYEGSLTLASAQRLEVQANIRGALSRREFDVYYQPVVNLSGRVAGTEALVRWHRPAQGIVLPDAFIPIAEETGLIFEIDRLVLFEACRRAKLWQTQMLQPGIVSVNLSPRELIVDETETTIRSALEYSGLPPSNLEIEVTESALTDSGDRGSRLLKRLKESLGVKIAIDDFGKGASSLGRLHEMPVDKIKIDRSFVSFVDESVEKQAICELIAVLGQKLGLTVQGEGIERPEELEVLKTMGCSQFQGYLFGKPMPADDMEVYLRADLAANDVVQSPTG
ncbi:PAS domain S-box protein [Amorphus orientalis]|uniref:Diguanylate cyclase (GGDEF)-like protein/PAS domain S-box-containing protein n=1 Tax=Amorphus orientalis TaxID=649198 RepID=A0AAE4ARZ2_9HYPH|nr:PAS domain S-box protein [Amorphus orientalis]MDQ0314430.1 diguanylate cyclase (GGDEF)-like protein/PAS domain S-box-containing protein [Amorphus orientalis]